MDGVFLLHPIALNEDPAGLLDRLGSVAKARGIDEHAAVAIELEAPQGGAGNIQPSIARAPSGELVAYMRDNGPPPKRLHLSRSSDDGATWGPVHDSGIANPGSAADIVTRRALAARYDRLLADSAAMNLWNQQNPDNYWGLQGEGRALFSERKLIVYGLLFACQLIFCLGARRLVCTRCGQFSLRGFFFNLLRL